MEYSCIKEKNIDATLSNVREESVSYLSGSNSHKNINGSDNKYSFRAVTPQGTITLRLSNVVETINNEFKRNPIPSFLLQDSIFILTLLLSVYEEYIQVVEEWIGCPLDFVPNTDDGLYKSKKIDIEFFFKEDYMRFSKSIVLSINFYDPKNLVNLLERSTENMLKYFTWSWPCLPCKFRLSKQAMLTSEITLLENKGLLLIKDSFSTQWYSEILYKENSETIFKPVRLDFDHNSSICRGVQHKVYSKKMSNDSSGHNINSVDVDIVIDSEFNVPIDFLMAEDNASSEFLCLDENVSVKNFILSKSIRLYINKKVFAKGRLIPLSLGYGVFIDMIV